MSANLIFTLQFLFYPKGNVYIHGRATETAASVNFDFRI